MINKFLNKIIEKAYAQELIPCPDGSFADPSVGCVEIPGAVMDAESNLASVILRFADGLMTVIAAIAIAALIYGGIHYAMAMGNKEKLGKAKRIMFWSVFGLVVALLAKFVVNFILEIVV